MAFLEFPNNRITVDGEDISSKVRNVTLHYKPGSLVTVTVELDALTAEVKPDGMIIVKTRD